MNFAKSQTLHTQKMKGLARSTVLYPEQMAVYWATSRKYLCASVDGTSADEVVPSLETVYPESLQGPAMLSADWTPKLPEAVSHESLTRLPFWVVCTRAGGAGGTAYEAWGTGETRPRV